MSRMLNFLKKNENTRKIFGKRELKIIEKQLNGINLTQSEKNRLSRDVRKKFEFMHAVSAFSDEFKLKKASNIKEIIEESREEILNDKLGRKIREIWLFGSVVENTLTSRSDIDIAVLIKNITKKEAFSFRKRISGRVSDKIDMQVFDVLPEKIKKTILKNHKVIYKNG